MIFGVMLFAILSSAGMTCAEEFKVYPEGRLPPGITLVSVRDGQAVVKVHGIPFLLHSGDKTPTDPAYIFVSSGKDVRSTNSLVRFSLFYDLPLPANRRTSTITLDFVGIHGRETAAVFTHDGEESRPLQKGEEFAFKDGTHLFVNDIMMSAWQKTVTLPYAIFRSP